MATVEGNSDDLKQAMAEGIPMTLPDMPPMEEWSHAPRRKDILNQAEKRLALANALRYFPESLHAALAPEFTEELKQYGRIYMYRYRPAYEIKPRNVDEYPGKCLEAKCIIHMIHNNLDPRVAQHPQELITYGGNGAVFQNWAQFRLTMKYLSQLGPKQTLVMYSGHPMGIFPSHERAPRVVVTNGLVIPNMSSPDHYEKGNALGVTQYGQMTAGSFMYIGPQGIVHGTTITVLNAGRMVREKRKALNQPVPPGEGCDNMLFVTSGLGGMSGAQPKAGTIAGCVTIVAEVDRIAASKRHEQGWVDYIYESVEDAISAAQKYQKECKAASICFLGNVADLWIALAAQKIKVDLGSDQSSLHNPFSGGYYPQGVSFEEGKMLISEDPEKFKELVYTSLRMQITAINECVENGMYFFDYGNALLLQASRAGADVLRPDGSFKFPSYVQDIMGPMCFDYGFGPFRWVCCSAKETDLELTDSIALDVLREQLKTATEDIQQQVKDNIRWIEGARENKLVVGSQARILYADCEGRQKIAAAFNEAIRQGRLGPVVLGRDHHDVSGTDSPYRETSNIYDGSNFCADMAVQNFVGDAFRGASWVSLHNGGGVGWGEVMNGGFGLVLDGTQAADERLEAMLHWDVNNGVARRAWARNTGSVDTITRAMQKNPDLTVTLPNFADDKLLERCFPG